MNFCRFLENVDHKMIIISALSTAVSILTYKLFFTKSKKPTQFEKVLKYITIADSKELNKILNVCIKNKNIIIPNWYTWYDLMELTDESISKEKWLLLHSRSEELSKQLNDLVIQWNKQLN
jgi:hypothetical protein